MRFTIDDVTSPSQFAYRPNLSTTDALLKYIDGLAAPLDNPGTKFIQSAFLGVCKVFYRLQFGVVIENVIANGYSTKIVSLLVFRFLIERKQYVKFSNCFSDYILTHVCSPQGTKLSRYRGSTMLSVLQTIIASNMQTILPFIGIAQIILPQT